MRRYSSGKGGGEAVSDNDAIDHTLDSYYIFFLLHPFYFRVLLVPDSICYIVLPLFSILPSTLRTKNCAPGGGHGTLCPWRNTGVPLRRSGKW